MYEMQHSHVIESAPAETFFLNPKTIEERRFVGGELLV